MCKRQESQLTWLCVAVRERGGKALGVLQHRVNLWPSQKARTQLLIPDALSQPLDDRGGLPKRLVRLRILTPCLIHASQRRLDLRIPPELRNEMSTKQPKSCLKTLKYSTLTPKKVSDSSVTPKKGCAYFIK